MKRRTIFYALGAAIMAALSVYYKMVIEPAAKVTPDLGWYYLDLLVILPLLFLLGGALLIAVLKCAGVLSPLRRRLRGGIALVLLLAAVAFALFFRTNTVYAIPFVAEQRWVFALFGICTELCLGGGRQRDELTGKVIGTGKGQGEIET